MWTKCDHRRRVAATAPLGGRRLPWSTLCPCSPSSARYIHFRCAPPRHRSDAAPQGRVPGKPRSTRRDLPSGRGRRGAARADRRARGRPHRILPRGRRARPRGDRGPAVPRSDLPASRRQGTFARRRARLLRSPSEPPVQLRAVRHTWRTRRRHPARASQGVPADLRRVRRGAVRRGGPGHPGFRYPMGPRRHAHLRGRLALVHADAGRAGRRPAHHHSERQPGARDPWSRGRPGPPGESRPMEPDRPGHGGRARRLRGARSARGIRGREGISRRQPGGRSAWRRAGRRPDLRGGRDLGDSRFRGDHPRAHRSAAAGRPRDAVAAPARLAARCPTRRQVGWGQRRHAGVGRYEIQGGCLGSSTRAGGHAREPGSRPACDRPRADPAVAGRVHPRRSAAPPRVRAGRGRALGGRGQLAGGVPRGRGGGRRQRDRHPDAVPDLEPGEPGARPAGDRCPPHPRDDRGHQRRRGRPRRRGAATDPRRAGSAT